MNLHLRNIRITDGVRTVTLLSDLDFTISPQRVGVTATMASGRTVTDYIGTKMFLTVPTGWLSPSDLITLRQMVRGNTALTVDYPDIDGDKSGQFLISEPVYRAFKYGADGVEQWYGVTLTMEAQEVER